MVSEVFLLPHDDIIRTVKYRIINLKYIRVPLLIPFGIPRQVFFSDIRHQKRSLASPNEYFGNVVAGEKTKLGNKMELLEVPIIENLMQTY